MLNETVATTAPETAPAERTLEQRVGELTGPARDHWRLTGKVEEAEAMMPKPAPPETPSSDVKADSSPAPSEPAAPSEEGEAQTETDSGPDVTPQPKATRQDRNWAALRRERDLLKAKLELLESERAASRTSAPATTPKEAHAPQAGDERPEFPDIEQFQDVKEWKKAVSEWKREDAAWIRKQISTEMSQRDQQSEHQTATTRWEKIKNAGREKYKDFEQVAFSDAVPASLPAIAMLQEREDGHELAYHLGKHLDVAEKLAELTDIPGPYRTYAELMAKAKQDPDFALMLGEKRALARAELQRIADSLKAVPPKPPARALPKPTSEVAVRPNASATTDELADIIKRGDQDAYNRYMNRRDLERAGVRLS